MANYMFVTDLEFTPDMVTRLGRVKWSCSKTTKAGDQILLYVIGVGVQYIWHALTDAESDPNWRFMCEVKRVKTFEDAISVAQLKDEFSREEWPVLYTHFRGLKSFLISDDVYERIVALG